MTIALRRLAGTGLALALTAGLVACSDDEPKADPGATEQADALASGLAEGSLDSVAFTELSGADATADYQEVVAEMGDIEPSVSVESVDQGEDGSGSATATLDWSWPVAGEEADPWTYQSTATIAEDGGEWKVDWERSIVEPSLRSAATLDRTTLLGNRGDITGANGLKLVTQRPVYRVGVDRSKVPAAGAAAAARQVAQAVDIDVADYVKEVKAAGEKAFVEAIVLRQGSVDQALRTRLKQIKGALVVDDEIPLAPTREFAAPILGTVGPVTAEMIKENPAYQAGDEAGISGLQARYDDQLRGKPGVAVDVIGSDGNSRPVFEDKPENGKPLETTLDGDLQETADRLLGEVGPPSALVAIQPSTGNILAAANGPANDGLNLATYGQLPPGSTFKAVTSLALLRAGVTPDTRVACTPSINVDGYDFTNYSDFPSSGIGRIPLRTAVADSCNTAFISERQKLGPTDLFEAAKSLGMGVDHDLGFPAYFGQVEPPSGQTEKAADMIGQGTVLASPMTMATVLASIQGGELVVPTLLPQIETESPDAKPLTGAEAKALRSMLRGVVTDGSGRALADLPGPPVIAKTGTAEFERKGKVLTHAWMMGAQGDLAVAVFVETGASGSAVAGPVLREFLASARTR